MGVLKNSPFQVRLKLTELQDKNGEKTCIPIEVGVAKSMIKLRNFLKCWCGPVLHVCIHALQDKLKSPASIDITSAHALGRPIQRTVCVL